MKANRQEALLNLSKISSLGSPEEKIMNLQLLTLSKTWKNKEQHNIGRKGPTQGMKITT